MINRTCTTKKGLSSTRGKTTKRCASSGLYIFARIKERSFSTSWFPWWPWTPLPWPTRPAPASSSPRHSTAPARPRRTPPPRPSSSRTRRHRRSWFSASSPSRLRVRGRGRRRTLPEAGTSHPEPWRTVPAGGTEGSAFPLVLMVVQLDRMLGTLYIYCVRSGHMWRTSNTCVPTTWSRCEHVYVQKRGQNETHAMRMIVNATES